MARLVVSDGVVCVELRRGEKIAGLLPDLRMPATAVEDVQVLKDGFTGVTGMRAPGLAGSSDRPFLFLDRITVERLSFGLRWDTGVS